MVWIEYAISKISFRRTKQFFTIMAQQIMLFYVLNNFVWIFLIAYISNRSLLQISTHKFRDDVTKLKLFFFATQSTFFTHHVTSNLLNFRQNLHLLAVSAGLNLFVVDLNAIV